MYGKTPFGSVPYGAIEMAAVEENFVPVVEIRGEATMVVVFDNPVDALLSEQRGMTAFAATMTPWVLSDRA